MSEEPGVPGTGVNLAMIRDLPSTAPSLKNHSKIKEISLSGQIFCACGAPKKEGGLAALAERDPPPL